MAAASQPTSPSLPWRVGSVMAMAFSGSISRAFLFGLNRTQVYGLDQFLEILDARADIEGRQRGLITGTVIPSISKSQLLMLSSVSNHVAVIDDPLIWGTLPFRFHFNPSNHRWSLGSYDICFTNKFRSTFFALGQVLPTHRLAHSPHGGLFQPTMTQAVRLLCALPFPQTAPPPPPPPPHADLSPSSPSLSDPFSSPHLTYSTNGLDTFPAPAAYSSRRYSWIHIFPEGKVHQRPDRTMRYFKWGVARLILEPNVCPDVIPIWIEGNELVMHESRQWPRFVPRARKDISVTFGAKVDTESVFGDLRTRWQRLRDRDAEESKGGGESERGWERSVGELSERLMYSSEAVELRKECTRRVRAEVLKLRRSRGLPDEDPKQGLVATWAEEGGKREGRMKDGSWVRDT